MSDYVRKGVGRWWKEFSNKYSVRISQLSKFIVVMEMAYASPCLGPLADLLLNVEGHSLLFVFLTLLPQEVADKWQNKQGYEEEDRQGDENVQHLRVPVRVLAFGLRRYVLWAWSHLIWCK